MCVCVCVCGGGGGVLHKPVLERGGGREDQGMTSVAYIITGHEKTQFSRVCYFHFFDTFLASK